MRLRRRRLQRNENYGAGHVRRLRNARLTARNQAEVTAYRRRRGLIQESAANIASAAGIDTPPNAPQDCWASTDPAAPELYNGRMTSSTTGSAKVTGPSTAVTSTTSTALPTIAPGVGRAESSAKAETLTTLKTAAIGIIEARPVVPARF
ncbi:MAG: hypothetical protein BroJett003_11440 [Planctomycetota bacterium]|nr:MAG: hypothetical protein BroJett003_11440 [Planctomycetota bacterium]